MMTKRSDYGTCKLCLEYRELRKSHFMPAALYPKHVKKKMRFAIRDGKIADSGCEMTAYALCAECEQRFDERGESEALAAVGPKAINKYPLSDRLRLAMPHDNFRGAARFAGYDVGLNMEKFAYLS